MDCFKNEKKIQNFILAFNCRVVYLHKEVIKS